MTKKTFKQASLLLTVAFAMALSSCISESYYPNIEENDEPRLISLRISRDSAVRSESPAIPDGAPTVFNRGDLYLVDSDGLILRHFTISTEPTNTDAGVVNITQLQTSTGVPIDNIPGSVTRAYIIGNTSENATSGGMPMVGARLIDVVDQRNADNVNLWGYGNLYYDATVGGQYTSDITLRSTVARVEVGKFAAVGNIVSFTVEGIFIDNFHRRAQVNGTVPGNENLVSNGTNGNLFSLGSSAYPLSAHSALFDWYAGGLASSINSYLVSVVPPSSTQAAPTVWAYNLFANAAGTTPLPRIIVRFSNVEVRQANGTTQNWGTRFITVGNFTNTGNGLTLSGLQAGRVFHIPIVMFSDGDLSLEPNSGMVGAVSMLIAIQ